MTITLPASRLIAKIKSRKCLICGEPIHVDPDTAAWVNTSIGTVDLCASHDQAEFTD